MGLFAESTPSVEDPLAAFGMQEMFSGLSERRGSGISSSGDSKDQIRVMDIDAMLQFCEAEKQKAQLFLERAIDASTSLNVVAISDIFSSQVPFFLQCFQSPNFLVRGSKRIDSLYLSVEQAGLSANGLKCLITFIACNTTLVSIDLSDITSIPASSIDSFISSLHKNFHLEDLKLPHTTPSQELAMKKITKTNASINRCRALTSQSLVVSYRSLTSFPSHLFMNRAFSSIIRLDLSNNHIATIDPIVGTLSSLQ